MAIFRLIATYTLVLLATLSISAWRLNELTLGSAARGAWMPFLRPLIGAGFEVSLLLAVPAALLVARAGGLSRLGSLLAFVALGGIGVWGAVKFDPGALAPGQLADALLRQARGSCEHTPERKADVPLLAMSWSCASAPPRLQGRAPMGKRAEFSAAEIRLASDLRTISLDDLELRLGATLKRGEIRIRAGRATIRGLSPWGRPADVPLPRRLLRALLAALLTCGAGMFAIERLGWRGRTALIVSLVGGIAEFLAQRRLDRLDSGSAAYFALTLTGPLAVGLAALLLHAIKRYFSHSEVAR